MLIKFCGGQNSTEQTWKRAFLKWWEQKLNRNGGNFDCFSIYGLCRAFNSFLSIQVTGPDSDQRLQLVHTGVCTRHFQHLSLWSLSGSFFHLHRKLSCAATFIPHETRSEQDRERYEDKGSQREVRVGGFIIDRESHEEAAGKKRGERERNGSSYILWCYGERFGRSDTPSHKVGSSVCFPTCNTWNPQRNRPLVRIYNAGGAWTRNEGVRNVEKYSLNWISMWPPQLVHWER